MSGGSDRSDIFTGLFFTDYGNNLVVLLFAAPGERRRKSLKRLNSEFESRFFTSLDGNAEFEGCTRQRVVLHLLGRQAFEA